MVMELKDIIRLINCPRCKRLTDNDEDAFFCQWCGKRLKMPRDQWQ